VAWSHARRRAPGCVAPRRTTWRRTTGSIHVSSMFTAAIPLRHLRRSTGYTAALAAMADSGTDVTFGDGDRRLITAAPTKVQAKGSLRSCRACVC
jgi:hypothetical protein